MAVKLLCIGDIHLGRRPTRLSREVLEHPGADALSPAAAWDLSIDEAIERAVDAVLLAGDVVEQDDDFYEAYSLLSAGVERLARHHIEVLAVAGNHDVMVLPRLAGAIDRFRLLGRSGRWEDAIVEGAGGARVRVVGWSFPTKTVLASPLADPVPLADKGEGTTIGLLHCDRDASGSPYAPVRSRELVGAPVAAWLLGHVHAPDRLDGERPIGYLGSLCGLDPTETGPHGPWLVEAEAGGVVRATHLSLAPMRWETLDVDVGSLAHVEDLDGLVVEAIEGLHEHVVSTSYRRPAAVGCRVRVVGRSMHYTAIDQRVSSSDFADLLRVRDDVRYFIDGVANDALPAVDLAELAEGNDPVGLLARKLLLLDRPPGDPDRGELVRAVGERLEEVARKSVYGLLDDNEPPDESTTIALVRRACLRALDALLAQPEGKR